MNNAISHQVQHLIDHLVNPGVELDEKLITGTPRDKSVSWRHAAEIVLSKEHETGRRHIIERYTNHHPSWALDHLHVLLNAADHMKWSWFQETRVITDLFYKINRLAAALGAQGHERVLEMYEQCKTQHSPWTKPGPDNPTLGSIMLAKLPAVADYRQAVADRQALHDHVQALLQHKSARHQTLRASQNAAEDRTRM